MLAHEELGEEVKNCIDVCYRPPGLPQDDVARAPLAEVRLLANAQQGYCVSVGLHPASEDASVVQTPSHLDRKEICFLNDPASQRVPPEIWEQISVHMPRNHLRTWLFVSPFHRDIASRRIFHTIDIYLEENIDNLSRGLDIFGRAKNDLVFANRVKSLRLHWAFKEGTLLDLMIHMVQASLPSFKAMRNFEWIGFPEMKIEMYQALGRTHKHLHGLSLIGWKYDPLHISLFKFDKLRKFALRVLGVADMRAIRTVLDQNQRSLKHLTLGGFLNMGLSWDLAFQTSTIENLTQIDLVDTCVSHFVLTRIASAHNLQSLTLHSGLVDAHSASAVFTSDRIIGETHTLWPHLEAFRFIFGGECNHLYQSVVYFLRKRDKIRRLDLGGCPWNIVRGILPDLRNLRVLGVQIYHLSNRVVESLVESIPKQMVAIKLWANISDKPLDQYAHYFTRFNTLSFLHLQMRSKDMPGEGIPTQPDWSVFTIATAIPSLDFLVWNLQPYVIVRPDADVGMQLKELSIKSWHYGGGVDFGSDDAAWLERKDVPLRF